MTSDEAVIAVIEALNTLAVPYMLVGSLSSNYYGTSRSTRDADFVVQLENVRVSEISQRLGPMLRLDPQMRFESITGTSRYIVQMTEGPFKIELGPICLNGVTDMALANCWRNCGV